MAEFLTTKGTAAQIENIMTNAKSRLVLISPYLQLSDIFFERLKDADRQKVKITLVYKKDNLKTGERNKLRQLSNLTLYCSKNLHAKCYFNEECMVITSMNMYEFSENNNREMGVLIRAKDDRNTFVNAEKEATSIVTSSAKTELRKTKGDYGSYRTQTKGHCIRCRKTMPYDLEKLYCRDCFKVWVEWKNPHHEESFCHTCGRPEPTTMLKPQCTSCYIKSQR